MRLFPFLISALLALAIIAGSAQATTPGPCPRPSNQPTTSDFCPYH